MDNQDDDSEWAEAISISYRGHGITMSATLSAKQGLKAESAYGWLLRAVRSVGFDRLPN